MKKYKIDKSKSVTYNGHTLYKIVALKKLRLVNPGDNGGWVEDEKNLSQQGDCWIYHDAKVYGGASVSGDARIHDDVTVSYGSIVCGNARVVGNAMITDGSVVKDNAFVKNFVAISGRSIVCDNAYVSDSAKICAGIICGRAKISGKTYVLNRSIVGGNAIVDGRVTVNDKSFIIDNSQIVHRKAALYIYNSLICGDTNISDNGQYAEKNIICENLI